MKETTMYQDKNCTSQNIQPDHSKDLIIKKVGANKYITERIKTINQLLKLFWLIIFINLSFRLLGKNHCSIEIIVQRNDIIMAISLLIISRITFIIAKF